MQTNRESTGVTNVEPQKSEINRAFLEMRKEFPFGGGVRGR